MQTREPRKRVNWIFVVILIIAIPIIVFTIFMMNTVQDQTKEDMKLESDSTIIEENRDIDTTGINTNK